MEAERQVGGSWAGSTSSAVMGGKWEKQCQGPLITFLGHYAVFRHAHTLSTYKDSAEHIPITVSKS